MQIRIFTIPIHGADGFNDELNRFLRGHKVLEVEQQLVQSGSSAHWTFCVRYVAGGSSNSIRKERKDYKELLPAAVFARFSELRQIRKQIAQEDGVPAFAVFTDEELAGLAALNEFSPASMQTVKGIGEKKIAKYAERFLKAFEDAKNQ